MKKAIVNKEICIGCGACQEIAKGVFEIDNDGLATVVCEVIEADIEEDVIDAAEGCPTSAITIKDDEN